MSQSPDSVMPTKKNVIHAMGSTGRRAAGQAGLFRKIARCENPTDTATQEGLCNALGIGATGSEARAAKAAVARMIQRRKQRQHDKGEGEGEGDAFNGEGEGKGDETLTPTPTHAPDCLAEGEFRRKPCLGHRRNLPQDEPGVRINRRLRPGTTESGDWKLFGTVLSTLAKERVREGLKEIASNPSDLLRCDMVEVEPSKHSRAVGCHLIKGWAEQKIGNDRRVTGDEVLSR